MKHNFKTAAEFEEKKPDRFAGAWEMDEKEAEEIKMELKDAWKKWDISRYEPMAP